MTEMGKNTILILTMAGKKVTAVSFILLILIANFWLIKRFTGEAVASWSQDLFYLGVCGAGFGFLLMVPGLIYPPVITDDSSENSESVDPDR